MILDANGDSSEMTALDDWWDSLGNNLPNNEQLYRETGAIGNR